MSSESSAHSSPICVQAMSPTFSDIESVDSFSDHSAQIHMPDRSDTPIVIEDRAPVHPEFSFPDGTIKIQTTEHVFWVHEYHINKFSVFAALIQAAKGSETFSEPGQRTVIVCEHKIKGIDIYNTLQVIYASHIDGIPDFDSNVMTSALRIASTFDYPALRQFAVSKLEGMNLPAIQRIQLSDEFSLAAWETRAFTELCSRRESISAAEAEILGMTRFVEMARIREAERTRWATKLVKEINRDLFQLPKLVGLPQPDQVGARENLEYTSGRSALPKCNCHSTKDSKGIRKIVYCDLHKVAPQVLMEGQMLLKQRNELLEYFKDVGHDVEDRLEREGTPGGLDPPTLEGELKRASWIRREHNVVS